ncbi:hypothetical protein C8R45DRAFT_1213375 [Mycena sanguinolenta]|nr:hypothetical protein C8R45DRAFT_1213375 [Mycena sanguinolenta]
MSGVTLLLLTTTIEDICRVLSSFMPLTRYSRGTSSIARLVPSVPLCVAAFARWFVARRGSYVIILWHPNRPTQSLASFRCSFFHRVAVSPTFNSNEAAPAAEPTLRQGGPAFLLPEVTFATVQLEWLAVLVLNVLRYVILLLSADFSNLVLSALSGSLPRASIG